MEGAHGSDGHEICPRGVPGSQSARELRRGLTANELAWVFDRLPSALFVLDRQLIVRQANLAGKRLAHVLGASARSGDPLLDAGRSPSLRHLASHLFQQAVLVERRVDTDEGMALAVRGFRHTDERLAVLIVDDVTSQERRAQAEMLHADGPHLRARIVLSRGVTE